MSDIDDLLIRDYNEDHDGPVRMYSECPLCDGPLVYRVNSYTGQGFMGCKQSPKCSGSVSMERFEAKEQS